MYKNLHILNFFIHFNFGFHLLIFLLHNYLNLSIKHSFQGMINIILILNYKIDLHYINIKEVILIHLNIKCILYQLFLANHYIYFHIINIFYHFIVNLIKLKLKKFLNLKLLKLLLNYIIY
mmetsp:Transcript_15509/g.1392  ORF Transcript_15509/g.1392 Transcript_15509/m.1392 type:complete len:121 (+) Transcript_15509:512-874(+)